MLTPGFMSTPFPIFAPNKRSKKTLRPEEIFQALFKNKKFTTYHNKIFILGPGWYQELLNEDRSAFMVLEFEI